MPWWHVWVAILGPLLATGVRLSLDGLLANEYPFSAHYVVIAWIAGRTSTRAGIYATLISIPMVSYFFISSRGHFVPDSTTGWAGLAIFLFVCAAFITLGHRVRTAAANVASALVLAEVRADQLADIAAEHRRAEVRLRNKQNWLRLILSQMGEGLIATGADGAIRYINPFALHSLGLQEADVVKRPIGEVFKLIGEHDDREIPSPASYVLTGMASSVSPVIARLAIAEGSPRLVEVNASQIREGESVGGVIVTFRDIALRRQTENELVRRSEQIQWIEQSSGIAVWERDLDAKTFRLSHAGATLFGIGRSSQPYSLAEAIRYVHPEDRTATRDTFRRAVVDGKPYTAEYRWLRPSDGRTIYVEDRVSFRRDATGRLVSAIGVSVDMTERYHAGEALRRSEAQFRQIADIMPQMVWTTRPDGYHEFYNRRWYEFIGASEAQSRGEGWADPLHPEDAARARDRWQHSLTTGEPYEIEYRFRSKDGDYRWFLGRALPVRGEDGAIRNWFGTCTDIDESKRLQEERRASERRYRQILDALPEVGYLASPLGEASYFNRRWYDITGQGETQSIGLGWLEAVALEDREIPLRSWAMAHAERTEIRFEVRLSTVDGGDRWFVGRAVAFTGNGGRIEGYVGTLSDVDAFKRTEAALRAEREELARSRQLFRRIAEASPDAVFLFELSRQKIRYASHQLLPALGYLPQELASAEGPMLLDMIHPADRDAVSEISPRLERLGDGEVVSAEMRVRHRDEVYRIMRARLAVFERGTDGRPLVIVGVANDVTGTRRSEAEKAELLKRETARVEQLGRLNETSSRLHASRTLGDLLNQIAVSARRLIGTEQASVTYAADGQWSRAAVASSFSERYSAWAGWPLRLSRGFTSEAELATAQPQRVTYAGQRDDADGDEFLASDDGPPIRGWLAAPLIGEQNQILGIVELSERSEGEFSEEDLALLMQLASIASGALDNARLYAALREADRRKDEFLATLAHELRNPLAPVRTGLELLRRQLPADDSTRDIRDMLQRQVVHMVRLIDELLDLSRINNGKIHLQTAPADLRTVAHRAVETARPLIDERRQALRTDFPDEAVPVEADGVRLAQAATNLLINASKYTPEGGQIWLSVGTERDLAFLRVRDDGIGIEGPMLRRVFEMFTQEKRSEANSQGGLGIGLTLVQGLVQLHGGTVEAESAGRDRGSTFTIRLPIIAAQVLTVAETPSSPADLASVEPLRILVVDDNVDSAKTLATLLGMAGHAVELAHDGAAGLELARSSQFGLAFLDIGLPGMSGHDLMRALRRLPSGGPRTVVAMTGYGRDEDRRLSAEAGFDRHLVKPIDLDEVEEIVRQSARISPR